MVDELCRRGIRQEAVLRAMAVVPRHLFVDEALAFRAYECTTLPLGLGQTISNPLTVARMTELLNASPCMRVLEVGTGSGYQSAVLAAMGCEVYTTERLRPLYERTRELFRALDIRRVHMILADGTMGYPRTAPYDRIIVTAGGPQVPKPLLSQLDENGIMLIPVGDPHSQRLIRVVRTAGGFTEEDCGAAAFVDLVGNHGW